MGHTIQDTPPNYIQVYVRGSGLHNTVRPVTVTGLFRDGVLATLDKLP